VRFLKGDFTKSRFSFDREYSLVIASEVFYYQRRPNLKEFLERVKTKYLISSNFWTVAVPMDRIIKRSNYLPIKGKWVLRFEKFFLKATHIVLWKKV